MTLEELSEKHAHMLSRYFIGFEFGAGWIVLIDRLMIELDALHQEIKCTQAKSKYATLSFYLERYSDEAMDIIDRYEQFSAHTCERCGRPGSVRNKGWLEVLCDLCVQHSATAD